MTAIPEPRHDDDPGAEAIARSTPPEVPAHDGLSRDRIHEYIWARYVEFSPAPFDLEEDQALALLGEHYLHHPLAEDTECFYYGILAFERYFAGGCQERSLRSTAIRAFLAYRDQTAPGFAWDAVEDRCQDLLEHH